MSRKIGLMLVAAAVVLGAVAAGAQDETDVGRVVRLIERNEFRFPQITYRITLRLIEGGTTTRTIGMQVYAKGSEKLLVRVLSPGEVAGMAILQLGSAMHIYNPEDRSVRRIATSARAQGFVGTDYAPADVSFANMTRGYTATLLETTDRFYKVQFVPDDADVSPYSKLVIHYDRQNNKATKVEMYLDGELAKTMDRDRFVNRDGFNDFTHQQIINHRANRITEVEISDWDLTTALDDRMFSTRTLMLGE